MYKKIAQPNIRLGYYYSSLVSLMKTYPNLPGHFIPPHRGGDAQRAERVCGVCFFLPLCIPNTFVRESLAWVTWVCSVITAVTTCRN